MPKGIFAVLAKKLLPLVVSFLSLNSYASDVPPELVGTWKLTSWTVQAVGEDSREPFGPNAKGRIVITKDGYWTAVLTGANRRPAKTVDEKAALLDTLLAYSGKYSVVDDQITILVDMSSNEIYTGTNQRQTRFFKIEGNKLSIRTAEMASAALPGKRVVVTLACERE